VQCQQQQGVQAQQQQGVNGEDSRFLQVLQQQQRQTASSAASSGASAAAAASAACGLHDSSLLPAASVDLNNQASSSSSAALLAIEPTTPTWMDCGGSSSSSRGIGAVVLEAWPGRQRGYQPTRLLVAGGHDLSWRGLKAVELYDPRSDSWSPGPTLPAALPFAGRLGSMLTCLCIGMLVL
jgi:hypothetical protein